MLALLTLPFVFPWLVQAFSTPSPLSPFVVHEKRSHTPSGWTRERKHDALAIIPLRFGLTQANTHKLEEYLYDVSHPESPNYGKHWAPEEVATTFAPSDESVSTVHAWLSNNGIQGDRLRTSASKGWIELDATVEEAERILLTEYHVYKHDMSGQEHAACDEYHLPDHIAPHVEIVTPTVHFDAVVHKPKPMASGMETGLMTNEIIIVNTTFPGIDHCDTQISLDCLRALYNFNYTPTASELNSYGIVEYTPSTFRQADMDHFFENYSIPELIGRPPYQVSIDGGFQQTDNQSFNFVGESHLDLQYAMGLVTPKLNVTLYQVGDPTTLNTSFNNFLDAIDGSYCTYDGGDDPAFDAIYPDAGYDGPTCGTAKPAAVISTSYAYNEADLTPAYMNRQCNEYGKLGLMGVTILYSSGDNGVAGNNALCLNSNGSQTLDGRLFNPTFPSSCGYVTSVGATMITPGNTVKDPEVGANKVTSSGALFSSSGGFSNVFPVPQYQKDAVDAYLKNFKSDNFTSDVFNSTGYSRGIPDISTNGVAYVVAGEDEFILENGTSASSPTLGAILAMINDARLAAGKKTIGFINPTIYSEAFKSAFNDITSGTNPGCGTEGFSAGTGWDPLSGVGTPNFEKLKELWLALP